jgi:hypothetical protein
MNLHLNQAQYACSKIELSIKRFPIKLLIVLPDISLLSRCFFQLSLEGNARMLRSLLPISISIVLLFFVSLPASAQNQKERAALRGVNSLYVSIVMEREAPGFDNSRFLIEMRERLERGGLTLSPTDKAPAQVLRLSILPKYDERLRVYLVAVTLELLKSTVTTAGNVEYSAMWMRRDVVAAEKWSALRNAAEELVDEFVTDWKTARSGMAAMPLRLGFEPGCYSQLCPARLIRA